MPEKLLEAGEEYVVATSARYLSIINSTGQFNIESEQIGVVVGKVGRQYVLDNINQVTFVNPGTEVLHIEYETANIQIFGSGSGTVTVDNKITVERIEEGVDVKATAIVDDGKMRVIQPNTLIPLPVTSIPSKGRIKLVDARDTTSRRVTIQVISENLTTLHLGTDSTIDATKGVIARGSIDAIATAVMNNTSALWLYNPGEDVATVTGMEEYRP